MLIIEPYSLIVYPEVKVIQLPQLNVIRKTRWRYKNYRGSSQKIDEVILDINDTINKQSSNDSKEEVDKSQIIE